MKKKISLLLLACLLLFVGNAMAQNRTVTGSVVSSDDGQPIIGASVVVDGSKIGAATSVDGTFSITGVPANAKYLKVSYLGYKTKVVGISANVKITLQSDDNQLNEVVVTAMGITRQQRTLGYSATTLKSDELVVSRNTDVTNSLAGKVAGVQIQSTSSQPGSSSNVVIRGYGSINGSNQPLYVIDGVPMQQTTFDGENGGNVRQGYSSTLGGISNVSPDDIESMTILKGAAATALYGSRAANGVIVITTKSGKKGDGRNFTITYNGGVQARMVSCLPDFQNEFGQGWNGKQTFTENGSWGPALDGSMQVYGPVWNSQQMLHQYSAKNNNVKNFFDTGWSQNHDVAFSGVSNDNKATYYLSYSYADDNGIMPGNSDTYKRNTIAFRGSYDATKWMKLSSSVNFAKTSTDMVGAFQGTSVIDGLYEFPRDIDLNYLKDTKSAFGNPEAYYTPYGITNPYWSLENNYNHNDSKQIYGKIQADIKPIQDLTLTYRFGFDYTDYDMKVGVPKISFDGSLLGSDELSQGYKSSAAGSMNQEGYVYTEYMRKYELNHDFLANYAKKFINGRLDLNATVGLSINERYNTVNRNQTTDLTFTTGFWDLSNGATKKLIEESQMKRRLVGLFGDITLGWDEMLYLNLTARNDWSSTLPINDNSYFYPGATLSWIFTKVLPENNVLTFGKARLAYGRTGNDADPYYTSARYVQAYSDGYYISDVSKFPMNGTNSFQASATAASNNLKPEMTTETEIGLNLQFFGGRIGLDAAYYNRVTKDQIFRLPVDPSSGYLQKVVNFGEVRNRGVEILLTTTPIKTAQFKWDLNFNFAVNKNKVLSMPASLDGGKTSIYSFSAGNHAVYMYAEEGKAMGEYYAYMPQRVTDPTSADYGKIIVDSKGMPVLSSTVQDTGKNMNNKWSGGVTTALSAYGFTLSAALDVRAGGYMFSRTKDLMQFTGNGTISTYNDRRPFVIPNSVTANTDGTYSENTTPIYMTNSSYQNYLNDYGMGQGDDFYLIDRSYVKLRNITLAYTFPRQLVHSIYLSDITLSIFCNNVFTWTAADNYYVDPETTTTGSDLKGQFGELYANPSCRTFGCNLSVKF
jgi:TonB-linked SusC/RagA family outer membrane protein